MRFRLKFEENIRTYQTRQEQDHSVGTEIQYNLFE